MMHEPRWATDEINQDIEARSSTATARVTDRQMLKAVRPAVEDDRQDTCDHRRPGRETMLHQASSHVVTACQP